MKKLETDLRTTEPCDILSGINKKTNILAELGMVIKD